MTPNPTPKPDLEPRRPGAWLWTKLNHFTDEELAGVAHLLARMYLTDLGVTDVTFRTGETLSVRRAFSTRTPGVFEALESVVATIRGKRMRPSPGDRLRGARR